MRKSIRLSIIAILSLLLMFALALPVFAQEDDPRPEIGISFRPNGDVGVVVNVVRPESPAEEAGLQPDDVIVSIDGQFVTFGSLPEILGEYEPGDEVVLSILRDEETLEITVTLGTAPEREEIERRAEGSRATLGVIIGSDPSDAPVVTEVVEDSPAEEAGIQVDDVIIFADGQRVQNIRALREVLAQHDPGDEITLIVDRDGRAETITVTLGESEEIRRIIPERERPEPFFNRPFIGVSLGDNDDTPIVMRVMPGSPADEAGIEVGEVIAMFDGEEIETVMELIELVQQYEPGDEVPIVLRSGDESRLIFVTLGGR